MSIKKAKQIMEDLELDMVVVFGVDSEGKQYVFTSGKSELNSRIAADAGNNLKKSLKWPENMRRAKPIERICYNCEYWKSDYHRPGSIIESDRKGSCNIRASKEVRYEKDRSCADFSPIG